MTPRLFGVGLIALAGMAAPCAAVIIQGTELPPYIQVSNQLGMSHGAVFSSPSLPFVTFAELIPGVWGIEGSDPTANPMYGYGWFNAPIIVNFVSMTDGVTPAVVNGTISAMWGDGGGDLDGVDMRAYDLSGNLISTTTFTGITFTQIQITGTGIHRVEFWPNTMAGSPTSDTSLDWLSFPAPVVPTPSSVAVAALVGVAAARRRR